MDLKNVKKGQTFLFCGVVSEFAGTDAEPDERGNLPMAIVPICGTSPRSLNVIAGTVAKTSGFEVNERYAIQAIFMGIYKDPDTGKETPSFNYSSAGKVSFTEMREWKKDEPLQFIIQPNLGENNTVVEGQDTPATATAEDTVDNVI